MIPGIVTVNGQFELLDDLSGSSDAIGVVLTVAGMVDPLIETRLPNRI